MNNSFRDGVSERPNFQPEIREHQLSLRLETKSQGEIWELPIMRATVLLSH